MVADIVVGAMAPGCRRLLWPGSQHPEVKSQGLGFMALSRERPGAGCRFKEVELKLSLRFH